MRIGHVTPILVALALMTPGGSSASTTEEETPGRVEVADTANDVSVAGQTSAPSLQVTDPYDLLAGWVEDLDSQTIHLGVRLAAASPAAEVDLRPYATGLRELHVDFQRGDAQYGIRPARMPSCDAHLIHFKDDGYGPVGNCLVAAVDESAGEIVFELQRQWLVNENGLPLRADESLSRIHFGTEGKRGDNVVLSDRLPDSGDFDFTSGLGASGYGPLLLQSPAAMRVSNGEATTLVYNVTLTSEDDARRVELTALDLPAEWDLRMPPVVDMNDRHVRVPVLVSIPFAHEHGRTATFVLEARDADETDYYAQLELGVHWPEIAQPAGHHSRLYLHSAPGEMRGSAVGPTAICNAAYDVRQLWMNTAEDDASAGASETIPRYGPPCSQASSVVSRYAWLFPLTPDLLLGLDFLPGQSARFVAEYIGGLEGDATFSASLWHCASEDREQTGPPPAAGIGCPHGALQIAGTEQSARAPGPDQVLPLDMEMEIDEQADLLLPHPDMGLYFLFLVESPQPLHAGGPQVPPRLNTGEAHLDLPLLEFHDPIDDAFTEIGSLALNSTTTHRSANAGKTIVQDFRLRNEGEQPVDVELELVDPAGWASISGPQAIRVAAGEASRIRVAVAVPTDAVLGASHEVVLAAQDSKQPYVTAISKFRVTVVESEVNDESHLLDAEAKSKGIPLGLIVPLLGVMVGQVLRRR